MHFALLIDQDLSDLQSAFNQRSRIRITNSWTGVKDSSSFGSVRVGSDSDDTLIAAWDQLRMRNTLKNGQYFYDEFDRRRM